MSMNSSTSSEGVLVISCDDCPPENIILQILQKSELPKEIKNGSLNGYLWNFKTKYYSAEVCLYALKKKEALDTKILKTIKAVIFYFDHKKVSGFDEVLEWIPFLKGIDAEVQLLLYNNSTEESEDIQIKNILNWCVQNQYELIKLNTFESDNEDEEAEVPTERGYGRVVQALQSHLWADLIMKDEKNEHIPKITIEKESLGAQCNSENLVSKTNAVENSEALNVANKDLEEQLLANVLNGEDPGGESFEALFDKFASMKDRASGLSGEERKKYAEKVAVAFWRAMGGDEEEIEGLD